MKKIFIIDFGSQTTHLIGRRLRDLGLMIRIIEPQQAVSLIKKERPPVGGLIFSGGPASVYEPGAPTIDPAIFKLGIPILGICYGWQLAARLLGGRVISGNKEYGPAIIHINKMKNDPPLPRLRRANNLKLPITNYQLLITKNLPATFTVWLSHGDTVVKLPKGFEIVGSTHDVKAAFVVNPAKKIFGVQFHPEVEHTQFGKQILANFVSLCGLKVRPRKIDIIGLIREIRERVGRAKVVCAVSGGVDSTTTAVLINKAIGKNIIPIYIENGLMRLGTLEGVRHIFKTKLRLEPVIVQAKKLFLKKLKGVTDPEQKRKIIGNLYVELFEKEAKKIKGVKFLAQGTIYSDVIESKGTQKAAKIKSHHNVAGLPKTLNLKLLEPLRNFYKDEVRLVAQKLGLPKIIVYKQPLPGPGQAIRIIGEISEERLQKQQLADQIVLREIIKAGWYDKVFQSFPVMTGIKSTAVKGDSRFYGEVVALRVYTSSDIMTSDWARLPYDLLQKIAGRIVNEVPDISRVVYDITTKPPATMEWE